MCQKRISRVVLLVAFVLFGGSTIYGQESETVSMESDAFYYDHERQKYFSNEKSVFAIRPVSGKKYLERIEVSIDGENFVPYAGSISFKDEGPHQIRFRAVDPVLNWSPIQTFRIYVDKTAPKSQIVWRGPTYMNEGQLFINSKSILTVVSQDNLSGVANVYWDNNQKVSRFPGSAKFTSENDYSLSFYALDNVGNQETPYKVNFKVDGTGPQTSNKIEGTSFVNNKGMFINTGGQLVLSAVDTLSGVQRVEYQIKDNPVATYNAPIIISENETMVRYRAIDNVENKESWKDVKVFLDTKPPRIKIRKDGESFTISGKVYARPGFKFRVNVNDEGSGVNQHLVSFDGTKYSPTKDKSFSFDKSGEFQFHFKASDNVGNIEEANPYVIVIDNAAPQISLKSSESLVEREGVLLSSTPNRIFFEAVDAGVGLDRVEISYDGKSFITMNSPIELSEWKKKRQTLHYRAVDRLGNVGETQKAQIYVRTYGPRVDLFVESEKLPNMSLSEIKKQYEKKYEKKKQ